MGTFAEEYRNTIVWELDGAVAELNRTRISPSRMAFLVDEREWYELLEGMRPIIGYHSEDSLTPLPITRIIYRGLEVRKR